MFSFFKKIFNIAIIFLLITGGIILVNRFKSADIAVDDIFSANKEKVIQEVGDFSKVDKEFKIKTAVNVMGCKTVVAQHQNSGQKMIIVNSGKKVLLTKNDIGNGDIKNKLEELCKSFNYDPAILENFEITEKGYMNAYGQRVPYVKFCAKISKLPKSDISGIISVVDSDTDNQRLIVSLNDDKHYSRLITSEFYKNVQNSASKTD